MSAISGVWIFEAGMWPGLTPQPKTQFLSIKTAN
ncbi:hypothetical protein HCH_03799 [Hahella chejuensis KCTC 2396]|uniref:Uncharacterized protein n=1 Tax=Hahella chejuensis (strain KCTC 2396) TaxID=349521 RepID=Q2SFP4_HAHCH|nr:hypothetical protein HCH_03799 [Hahella chejuensis KCTC 2396]